MQKTPEQYEEELRNRDLKDYFIEKGNTLWASKVTEKIVFGACVMILVGFLSFFIGQFYK